MFKNKNIAASTNSMLFNQDSFENRFIKDMQYCRKSLVIESPFIRLNRVLELMPILIKLRRKNIEIVINTREPNEHGLDYMRQAEEAVAMMQEIGIKILYTVKHHRKLAIIDRSLIWEGSLNILSYYDSCEIMRRTVSPPDAEVLLNFINMNKYLKEK